MDRIRGVLHQCIKVTSQYLRQEKDASDSCVPDFLLKMRQCELAHRAKILIRVATRIFYAFSV